MKLHLIPNSHIDPVWLWDKYEGQDEVLNTFRTACALLDAFPGLTFSASSLQFYAWVLRHDPALFRRIQARVEEGRWEVVGGWWVEADSNLPTASSIRRQAALAQAFSRNHFGRESRVAYLPDTFGHPATLPAILAETGFTSFLFCRPGMHEKSDLPANLFHWEWAGARVLAYRLKHHYLQYGSPGPEKVDPGYILPKLNDPEYARNPVNAYLFGVGDHGGGPSAAEIRFYRDFLAAPEGRDAGFSTCERFFAEAAATPDIPAYTGDLHMHAVGCYAVNRRLKQAVREAEQGLDFAARAAELAGAPPPDLAAAWKTTLFNEFHDILPGSAAPHAVDQALAELGGVEPQWREAAYDSLKSASRKSPVRCKEGEFRIFNTLPFAVKVPLHIEAFPYVRNSAACGNLVPLQEVPPSVRCANRRWEFVDTLPARGFKSYAFDPMAAAPLPDPGAAHYRPGDAVSCDLAELRPGAEPFLREGDRFAPLLQQPIRFLVLRDSSDTWGHGVRSYDDVESIFALKESAILEGPVTKKLRQRFEYGRSTLEIVYSLYQGLPEVRAEITVHWAECRKILKMEIQPRGGRQDSFIMEAPGGWVKRKADGAELPLHNGVLLPGWRPFGLIQDGAFGCDCETGRLRLTLVRSSLFGYDENQPLNPHDPQHQTDQGPHRFRLLFISRSGLDTKAMEKEIAAFLEPYPVIRES